VPEFTLPDEKMLPATAVTKPPTLDRSHLAGSLINLNDFLNRIKEDSGASSPSLINELS